MHVALLRFGFGRGYDDITLTYNRAMCIVAAIIPMKMKMQASSTSTSTDLPHLCLLPFAFCPFYNTRIHSHLLASVPFAFSVRYHVQIVHLRTTSAGCARTCVDSGAVSTFRTKTLARNKMKLKQTGMAMNNAL